MPKEKTVAPQALQVVTCKSKVRRGSKIVECGQQFLRGTLTNPGRCPDRETTHMLPFKSGFCNNGWCEGTKAKTFKGEPAPTCRLILTCPCNCHTTLAKMFEMTGHDRIVVESSGYSPPHRTYWLPSDDPIAIVTIPVPHSGPNGVRVIESPAPDIVPATIERDFSPTQSGRTPKGQLELWVKSQCDIWLIDKPGFPCTPTYLSEHIASDYAVSLPSVGAISAVFERWIALGFAVIEKKPTRFVRYTDDGIKLGLEQMKANAKRKDKLRRADNERNLRPSR